MAPKLRLIWSELEMAPEMRQITYAVFNIVAHSAQCGVKWQKSPNITRRNKLWQLNLHPILYYNVLEGLFIYFMLLGLAADLHDS